MKKHRPRKIVSRVDAKVLSQKDYGRIAGCGLWQRLQRGALRTIAPHLEQRLFFRAILYLVRGR